MTRMVRTTSASSAKTDVSRELLVQSQPSAATATAKAPARQAARHDQMIISFTLFRADTPGDHQDAVLGR